MSIIKKYIARFSTDEELDKFEDVNVFAWLRQNVGVLDKDWSLDWNSTTSIIIYFAREEDCTRFILTWK